jgi:hypothetical protein
LVEINHQRDATLVSSRIRTASPSSTQGKQNTVHLKHNQTELDRSHQKNLPSSSVCQSGMFQSIKEGAFHANLTRLASAHPIPSSVSVLARLV